MTLLTSSNAPQASNQSNAATPPVSGNHLQFSNKNFYYHMGEAVPRRPAYSTSRVEINLKPNPVSIGNVHANQDFFDANTYLKLEQPISSTRFSDQTRLRTGNFIKNFNTNLVRSNHFNSSENLTGHSINPKSSRMKVLKLLEETRNEDEILYRKSAFQAIDSSKNLISSSDHKNHQQQQQQQIVPSLSSGTSSTTSSISYSATSQCLSNSNSANNSLCLSKSSENVNKPVGQNTAALTKSASKIPPDAQIRSGSVSSARSIYELRLKR